MCSGVYFGIDAPGVMPRSDATALLGWAWRCMPLARLGGSNDGPCIVCLINRFGFADVGRVGPANGTDRGPGAQASGVYHSDDRRNLASRLRLWNAGLWDRPEQRLFLPA